LIEKYLSPDNRIGDLPSPDSFLFNDSRTAPTFRFESGKRYLIRLVSTSAIACTQFHIDQHTLTVVGIDGVKTQPTDADTIVICAGQSYDMVVTGRTGATKSTQWIARMLTDMMTQDPPSDDLLCIIGTTIDGVLSTLGTLLGTIFGILTPKWVPQTVLDDQTLLPLDKTPIFRPVQQEIRLRTNQTYYEGIGTRIGLGVEPWVEPKIPSFYSALSTGDAALDPTTYGQGVDPWVLGSNKIIQIYMENPQPWPHPMHLHGHEFQVSHLSRTSVSKLSTNIPKLRS
jgi:iron transport multicopper oxidase